MATVSKAQATVDRRLRRSSSLRLVTLVMAASIPLANEAIAQSEAGAKSTAMSIIRPSDIRPRHDDKKLAALSIRVYDSKRLRLYTDIDPAVAKSLPPVIDAAYDAWVDYFGALPADREKSEFQVTGYVMTSKALFREAGLIPAELPDFVNGRHRGAEFWMLDQKDDYYRRHLLIHEATHCYMTILGGPLPPVWYMEGMAELFGTHRIEKDGTIRFRVMPENSTDYAGLGRITMIQRERAAGRGRTLDGVFALTAPEFAKNEPYAWSWGLCAFLDGHPRWKKAFRALGQDLTYRGFDQQFRAAFDADLSELRCEWQLFVDSIQDGFDRERAAVVFRPAMPQAVGNAKTVEVAADKGWQSSGVMVEAGRTYDVHATGRVTLATKPKPWISEPQGVSIRYFDSRPLGMLVGVIVPKPLQSQSKEEPTKSPVWPVIPVGSGTTLKPTTTGTLFLRVSDSWSELADNAGALTVTIERNSEK